MLRSAVTIPQDRKVRANALECKDKHLSSYGVTDVLLLHLSMVSISTPVLCWVGVVNILIVTGSDLVDGLV